jgi:hypothetical protein
MGSRSFGFLALVGVGAVVFQLGGCVADGLLRLLGTALIAQLVSPFLGSGG